MPALAVADALRANGADVHFVGGDRAESELVPQAGYEFHRLNVVSLPRRSPLGAARAAAIDAAALAAATALLARLRPRAVFGGGGYAAGPVGLAAAILRVPLVIAEIDGHLGLTNRLLAPLARRVCTALPLAGPPRSEVRDHRPPDPSGPSRPRSRTRPLRRRRERDACARLRRLAGRPLDQPSGARGVRRRRFPCAPCGRRPRPAAAGRRASGI